MLINNLLRAETYKARSKGHRSVCSIFLSIGGYYNYKSTRSSATVDIARIVPINHILPKTKLIFVADNMGLASVNLAAILYEITSNDGH